eukprot:scaffold1223_cov119-Cylindrotheca_fusiformis.AAC.12
MSHSKWRFRRSVVLLMLIVFLSCRIEVAKAVNEDNDYAEYVKEVLEEDQHHYGEDSSDHTTPEDVFQRRQAQAEQERLAKEQAAADRIAAERERAFQKELSKLDEEQRKAALKQKKMDARMVKRILRAQEHEDWYGVLGMRNWNLAIPSQHFQFGPWQWTFPGVSIKQTTPKDIRRAFRTRTKMVHPDKNRDGRANEAFHALEQAASILSDETTRKQYDQQMAIVRQERNAKYKALVGRGWKMVAQVFRAILSILGPFATPVLIIAALII